MGRELARLRERTGQTMAALAEAIGTLPPTLSRVEAGTRRLSEVKLIQYLILCGLKYDEIMPMVELARSPENGYHLAEFTGKLPDELIALIVHETTAQTIEQYENTVIPGLLQSHGYARALHHACGMVAEGLLEAATQIRMDRQSVLKGKNPPGAVFYLSEHVLRNLVGSPAVMHDQLLRLCFAAEDCAIRVVPSARYGETGAPGAFNFMTFAEHGPVASQDLMAAMVFTEKPHDLARYRDALKRLDRVALPARQSRQLIVTLADEYAWMETRQHAVRDVAQE
jgi:transcriptional regulator with XRE-family HTH domain